MEIRVCVCVCVCVCWIIILSNKLDLNQETHFTILDNIHILNFTVLTTVILLYT